MGEVKKSFKCTIIDCEMVFDDENNLLSHQRHHGKKDWHANTKFQGANASHPKHYEEFCLFNEVNLNPFDLEFRKASQSKNKRKQLTVSQESSGESLDTPCILPMVDSDQTISSTSRDDANLFSAATSSNVSSVSSLTQSEVFVSSSQKTANVRHIDPETERKEGRKKLTLIVSQSPDIQSTSSSVISTPTPVITAGPSVSQSLGVNNSSPLLNTPNILTASIPQITLNGVELSDLNTPGLSPTLRFISGSPPLDNSGPSNDIARRNEERTSTPSQVPNVTKLSLPVSSSLREESVPSTATVLQLLLKLPDGQSIPVEIPATPVTTSTNASSRTPVVVCADPVAASSTPPSTVVSTAAVAMNFSTNNPASSLAKMKLKQALSSSNTAAKPGLTKHSRAMTADRIAEMTRAASEKDLKFPSACAVGDESCDNFYSGSEEMTTGRSSCKEGRGARGIRKRRATSPSSDDDPEVKRRKFLERNRVAAVRCREKKKRVVEMMMMKSDNLSNLNQKLQSEVAALKSEVATLKSLLLKHKDCSVTLAMQEEQRRNGLPVNINYPDGETKTFIVQNSIPSTISFCPSEPLQPVPLAPKALGTISVTSPPLLSEPSSSSSAESCKRPQSLPTLTRPVLYSLPTNLPNASVCVRSDEPNQSKILLQTDSTTTLPTVLPIPKSVTQTENAFAVTSTPVKKVVVPSLMPTSNLTFVSHSNSIGKAAVPSQVPSGCPVLVYASIPPSSSSSSSPQSVPLNESRLPGTQSKLVLVQDYKPTSVSKDSSQGSSSRPHVQTDGPRVASSEKTNFGQFHGTKLGFRTSANKKYYKDL